MRFSVSGRVIAFQLALILAALVCAGCNLGAAADRGRATFEGAPLIHIAAPSPGQTFLAGAKVIVQARVENAGPDLARVSVLLDETLLGEKRNPNVTNAAVLPLTIDWDTSDTGDFKISVVAERGDGTFAREDVHIRVVAQGDEPSTGGRAPETAAPAPALDASPMTGRMLQPARIRDGPGATYNLVGNLDENEEILIIAVNPAREWYRIRADGQAEAWVYAEFARAEADTSSLPVETGPPLPGVEGVNLIVVDVQVAPPIVCNVETVARARIRNAGALEAQSVAWVIAQPLLTSEEPSLNEDPPLAYLKALAPGEEETLEFPLTLATGIGEEQAVRVVVDSGNHLAETNETDNIGLSPAFILQPGDCG